jgi:hypothetical protein
MRTQRTHDIMKRTCFKSHCFTITRFHGLAVALLLGGAPGAVAGKSGNGKPGGGGGGQDTTPPAQITDLVAFNDVNSGHFITAIQTVGEGGEKPCEPGADWEDLTLRMTFGLGRWILA